MKYNEIMPGNRLKQYVKCYYIYESETNLTFEDTVFPSGCIEIIFNLGTGNGVTVLEAIAAFEKVSEKKLNYEIGPRREGDVIAIYANNNAARETLNWQPKYSLDDMMLTAWNWEKRLKTDEKIFNGKPAELN